MRNVWMVTAIAVVSLLCAASAGADIGFVYHTSASAPVGGKYGARATTTVHNSLWDSSSDDPEVPEHSSLQWTTGTNGGIAIAAVRMLSHTDTACSGYVGVPGVGCGDTVGFIQAGWIRSDGPISVPFGDCILSGTTVAGMFAEWKHVGINDPYHCTYIPTPSGLVWGQPVVFEVQRTGGGFAARYRTLKKNGALNNPVCLIANCDSGLFLGFDTGFANTITESVQGAPIPCRFQAAYGVSYPFAVQDTQNGAFNLVAEADLIEQAPNPATINWIVSPSPFPYFRVNLWGTSVPDPISGLPSWYPTCGDGV